MDDQQRIGVDWVATVHSSPLFVIMAFGINCFAWTGLIQVFMNAWVGSGVSDSCLLSSLNQYKGPENTVIFQLSLSNHGV
jgi:hypothetical protein